ncbi:MAG: hypothetical protein ACYCS7_10210 [Acidimicrobiales bacterium]
MSGKKGGSMSGIEQEAGVGDAPVVCQLLARPAIVGGLLAGLGMTENVGNPRAVILIPQMGPALHDSEMSAMPVTGSKEYYR